MTARVWHEKRDAGIGSGAAGRVLRLAALAVCGAMSVATASGQASSKGSLLVLAKHDHTLAIVDPANLKVMARVPVGGEPHEVTASIDGRTAYVSNYGQGSLHTIARVDLTQGKPLPPVDLGPLWGPHGMTFIAGKTWFTSERAKVIAHLNPEGEKVDWILGTGQTGTYMLWVAGDEKQIVTANVGSGTISLIAQKQATAAGPQQPSKMGSVAPAGDRGHAEPDWDETVVKVGNGPEGFDVLTDAAGLPKTIWVANAKEGTVSIVDFATRQVEATLQLDLKTANRLRFTPDHKLALISMEKSPEIAVVDVAERKVVKRIKVGSGAAGILMQPDGARVFVACSPDNYVAVVDLKTFEVTGKIDVGHEPDGMAWAPAAK